MSTNYLLDLERFTSGLDIHLDRLMTGFHHGIHNMSIHINDVYILIETIGNHVEICP